MDGIGKKVVMVRYEMSSQSLRQLQRSGNRQRNDRWGLTLVLAPIHSVGAYSGLKGLEPPIARCCLLQARLALQVLDLPTNQTVVSP